MPVRPLKAAARLATAAYQRDGVHSPASPPASASPPLSATPPPSSGGSSPTNLGRGGAATLAGRHAAMAEDVARGAAAALHLHSLAH